MLNNFVHFKLLNILFIIELGRLHSYFKLQYYFTILFTVFLIKQMQLW